MKFIQSFIFNRTVLGLLVIACFVVTALDLFFDRSRTIVVNFAALQTAKHDAEIISQLSHAYKDVFSTDAVANNADRLLEVFNKNLSAARSNLSVKIVEPSKAADNFQSDAQHALGLYPDKPYYIIESGEGQSLLRYAIINKAFALPGEKIPSILELDIPMGKFEEVENKEGIKTLWVLLAMAIVSSISLAVFVGYLRHAAQVLAAAQATALEEQKSLTAAYERFFPHQFLELLSKKSILEIQLGDQAEKQMTVVFADIRDFTTLIEKMTAAQSFQFINSYLAHVGPVIRKNSGFIDKYIGDAVMSLFHQPENAITATIQIMQMLKESVGTLPVPIEIGTGIHCGSLMVGTVGETQRMDGTVISDVVNTSSRLEALNKSYGTHIIISEQVLASLSDKTKFKIRYLDHIYVKGKTSGIKIYEVYDIDSLELIGRKQAAQPDLDKAMEFYRSRQFKEAIEHLQTCQKILPADPLITLFLKRCTKFLSEGVGPDWEPIAKLSQKDTVD